MLERDGAVATIRFNRPQTVNAIDVPMARSFLAAARELARDASVRAVVLCGAGKGFMAGAICPPCAPIPCRALRTCWIP